MAHNKSPCLQEMREGFSLNCAPPRMILPAPHHPLRGTLVK